MVEGGHVLGQALGRALIQRRLGGEALELAQQLLQNGAHRAAVHDRRHLTHQCRLKGLAARQLLDLEQPQQLEGAFTSVLAHLTLC